jgi:protein-S-isoprenylcysteine O-methyltransferase Ste14
MRRLLGLVAGVVTHVLFAVTVWQLFRFLKGSDTAAAAGSLWADALLSVAFGVVHSILLYPTVRETLTRWIEPPFYGLFYCVVTCALLLGMFACWSTSATIFWEFTGLAAGLIQAAWYTSWALLIYGLWLGGFGYQTGGTPWWNWVRGWPQQQRPFNPRGVFRWIRHPAYLGFMGLVWFTPVITADRALLIVSWTVYVLVGSWLKDERLAHYIGEPYRLYQSRVPGYPGMIIGPLGRRPLEEAAMDEAAIPAPKAVSSLLPRAEPVQSRTHVTASVRQSGETAESCRFDRNL